jgi:hypothetical protein
MEAGRELDALVAEKVMGLICSCRIERTYCAIHGEYHTGSLRAYSTEIAAAWEVVEKVAVKGIDFYLEKDPHRSFYWCRFNDTIQGTFNREGYEDTRLGEGTADTAPLAICLAALEAVK